MRYLSCKETAERWGVSERRVLKLCSENRIGGAVLVGKKWIIPDDAQKPTDARVSTGKYAKNGAVRETISNITNCLFKGNSVKKMQEFPSESVDMVICSLADEDSMDRISLALPALWENYRRILRPNGIVVLLSQGRDTMDVIASNPDWFRYKYVWVRDSLIRRAANSVSTGVPYPACMDVCIFSGAEDVCADMDNLANLACNRDFSLASIGECGKTAAATNILWFTKANGDPLKNPGREMEALGRFLISAYTNKDSVILDNTCMDAGIIGGAMLEGRQFVGIIHEDSEAGARRTGDSSGTGKEGVYDLDDESYMYLYKVWQRVPDDVKDSTFRSDLIKSFMMLDRMKKRMNSNEDELVSLSDADIPEEEKNPLHTEKVR